MKDVQCYELFGGIALKNHAFSFHFQSNLQLDKHIITICAKASRTVENIKQTFSLINVDMFLFFSPFAQCKNH